MGYVNPTVLPSHRHPSTGTTSTGTAQSRADYVDNVPGDGPSCTISKSCYGNLVSPNYPRWNLASSLMKHAKNLCSFASDIVRKLARLTPKGVKSKFRFNM